MGNSYRGFIHREKRPPPKHRTRLCLKCGKRPAIVRWYTYEDEGKCGICRAGERKIVPPVHMPVYQTFDQVPRLLRNGTYVRILGNPEPWWDGVYRIFRGNSAQGFVWGKRVYPGPCRMWGYQGARVRELRPWPGQLPPEYTIPGVDSDQDV